MNEILYTSTRINSEQKTASQAIIKGIAEDGGLYVPTKIPKLTKTINELIKLNYRNLAFEILKLFYTDFTEDELRYCINNAYDEKFDTDIIAPIKQVGSDYFLELFHGPTSAFKDMALSILPYLMTVSAKKNNIDKKIIILTATSGDTGIAALEGFKNIPDTSVVAFYPKDGVSDVQKLQMITIDGNNTHAIGVNGNFDDTQTNVKQMFTNKDFNKKLADKNYIVSSANSINIGRLFPQVVYYFYAYAQLVNKGIIKSGDEINFTVPTGNFGNILSGYYAKQLGLPINKLICASNENTVLYDFFQTGIYDKNREFILTCSPSMDILISSNFERLINILSDKDTTTNLFEDLNKYGKYTFKADTKDFHGEFATDDETKTAINEVFKNGYLIDTHTAVAYESYKKYKAKTSDEHVNIILSTASCYKFSQTVCSAIDKDFDKQDSMSLCRHLEQLSGSKAPVAIANLVNKTITQTKICEKQEMQAVIEDLFK